MKKIFRLFKLFIKSSLVYKLPEKNLVLIYDPVKTFFDDIKFYLNIRKTGELYVRGETINIPILLYSFIIGNPLEIKKNYILSYIKFSKPKIVITSTDNDMVFYTLKQKVQNKIKFIVLQNGIRGNYDDFLEFKEYKKKYKEKLVVDYFLSISSLVSKKYKKYINAKFIPIGLLRNNLLKTNKIKFKKRILFISQFRKSIYQKGFYLNKFKKKIEGKNFYIPDINVLNYLANYIYKNKNNYDLTICLRSGSSSLLQKNFIKDIFKSKIKMKFIEPKNGYDVYKAVDQAAYIITLDSALGYEAFTRGSLVGFFTIRGVYLNLISTNFAWPFLTKKIYFWTNKDNRKSFDKVMKYLIYKKKECRNFRKNNANKIMYYDPGNTRLIKLFRELEVPLKKNIKRSFQIS